MKSTKRTGSERRGRIRPLAMLGVLLTALLPSAAMPVWGGCAGTQSHADRPPAAPAPQPEQKEKRKPDSKPKSKPKSPPESTPAPGPQPDQAFVPRRVPIYFIQNQTNPSRSAAARNAPAQGFPDENHTGSATGWRGPGAADWLVARIQEGIDRKMDVVFQLPHGKSSGIMSAVERYALPAYKLALIEETVEPFVRAKYASGELKYFGIYTGSHYSTIRPREGTLPAAGNDDPRIYDLSRPNQMQVFLDNYKPFLFCNLWVFDRGNSTPPNFQDNQSVLLDFNDRAGSLMGWRCIGEAVTDGPQTERMAYIAASDAVIGKDLLDKVWDPATTDVYWLMKPDDELALWDRAWPDEKKEAQIKRMADKGWVPAPMNPEDADLVVKACRGHPKLKW